MANSWPKWRRRAKHIQERLDSGATIEELANEYDIAPKSMRNRIGELKDDGLLNDNLAETLTEVDEVEAEIQKFGVQREIDGKTLTHKSTRLLEMSETEDKDPEFLLTAHGYDPNEWELVNSKSKIWHVYSKVDKIQTLYSSSITAKPKEQTYTDDDMMRFFERLSANFQSPVHTPTRYNREGKLLEIDIADLHVGKLAWAGDSGDTYNHEIARERFFFILNDVIAKTADYTFDRILFVWANDFFHVDGPSKTTTKGTPQDASMQFEHMFEFGAEMLVEGMDLLNQVAPITTMYMASNHDRLVSFFATKYLQAWYRNNKHVVVDSQPLSRKVVQFGQNLTGYTHGHLEKNQMGAWLAKDYKQAWGETNFHEVHAHHIHSERSIWEANGQITRFISSPTGTDRWHHDNAFTGATQKGQSFIYDREYGLENTINSTIVIEGKAREAIVI